MYRYSDNLTWELIHHSGPFVIEALICAVWMAALIYYVIRQMREPQRQAP